MFFCSDEYCRCGIICNLRWTQLTRYIKCINNEMYLIDALERVAAATIGFSDQIVETQVQKP